MPQPRDPARTLRLATRGSPLALAQSTQVARALEQAHANLRVELVTVTTTGDRVQDRPLHDIGGKGLFTREVEQALLRNEADLAVHSMKDLPVTLPLVPEAAEALVIAAVPAREDVRDVLVSRHGPTLADLPERAVVGTSSPRRVAQARQLRPDLRISPLRGNVDTRLARTEAGDVDACLLAAAGLRRLGRSGSATMHSLDPEQFIPAAGQGALAIQCRAADADLISPLSVLQDEPSRQAVEIERQVVLQLDGNCTSPIGVWAIATESGWTVHAFAEEDRPRRAVVRIDLRDFSQTSPGGGGISARIATRVVQSLRKEKC